jgi:hypothetical protein
VFAITPVMLYSTAIVAPNGLEMAAALAFWSALLALDGTLDRRRERSVLAVAVASAAVLMVDRTLGPLFALVILLTVWLLDPGLVVRTVKRHTTAFATGGLVVLLCVAWRFAWLAGISVPPGGSPREGSDWMWSVVVVWPMQTIAAFPLRDQPGAMIAYPAVLLVFLALVAVALRVGRGRERAALVLALATSLLLPFVLTALTYEGRGVIWQGRYGLPVTMGTVLLAAAVLDRRRWTTRLRPGLLLIASSLMAVVTAACFVKVVDMELRRAVSVADPAWHPPGVVLLVVLSAAAWLLLHVSYARVRVLRD